MKTHTIQVLGYQIIIPKVIGFPILMAIHSPVGVSSETWNLSAITTFTTMFLNQIHLLAPCSMFGTSSRDCPK